MSDTMLIGVLRMPVDDHGDLSLMQFIARAREAADRIKRDAERIAELEGAMRFQASAAKRGMDAARAHGAHMEAEARRLHAECNPAVVESERLANAQLTEELEQATAERELAERLAEERYHLGVSNTVELKEALRKVEAERDALMHLCRFVADLYCELDRLRYETARLPPHEIADHLICKWPVLQGTRNQLNIAAIGKQPYRQEMVRGGVKAMLEGSE